MNAIGSMVAAGYTRIKEMLVVGESEGFCTPCGACRQVINEFASADTKIYLFDSTGKQKMKMLGELLPDSFGPHDLEEK